MKTLIYIMFSILVDAEVIIPMNEENDGRALYSINPKGGYVIDHAYKGEILNWIQTGKFEYNEDFPDELPDNYTFNTEDK